MAFAANFNHSYPSCLMKKKEKKRNNKKRNKSLAKGDNKIMSCLPYVTL